MEAQPNKENFVTKNWEKIFGLAGLLFVAGGAFTEFKIMNKELQQTNAQVETLKKQLMEEIEQRTDDLEEWRAQQEGYQEGYKAALNLKNK